MARAEIRIIGVGQNDLFLIKAQPVLTDGMDRIVLAAGADVIMIARFLDVAGVKEMQLPVQRKCAAGIGPVRLKTFYRLNR